MVGRVLGCCLVFRKVSQADRKSSSHSHLPVGGVSHLAGLPRVLSHWPGASHGTCGLNASAVVGHRCYSWAVRQFMLPWQELQGAPLHGRQVEEERE